MNSVSHLEVERLSRELRPALLSYFSRRLGNFAEAEELTQEVFSRLTRVHMSSVASPDHYVFQIAANLLRDRARRERVRHSYLQQEANEAYEKRDDIDPFQIASDRELLRIVLKEIRTLPAKTRDIFILYRFEEVEKGRIAETFGLSVRMVEIHIRRALIILSERLGEHL